MFLSSEEKYTNTAYFKMSDGINDSTTPDDGKTAAAKPLVLIFSQEKDTRFLFQTLLEMWNYRVESCGDFKDLFLKSQKYRPALVLLDSVFPFDENINAVRGLRDGENFADTPVIMISGFSQPRFRLSALTVGATEYLIKPIDFDALEICLKRNLGRLSNSGETL